MEVTNAGRVDSVSKVSSTRVSHLGRSKSASDRNLELTKSGKSHCIARYRTECKGSHNILKILKSHGSQSSYNQDSSESARHTTLNSRYSLEDDYFYLLDIDIFLLRRNCQPLGGVISHELRNIIFISVQAEYPKRWSDAWLLYIDGCVLTHLKSLVNCILLLKIIYQCCPSSKRLLVEQLENVNVSVLETNAKLAFWINIYNSLPMHAAYNIVGRIITANCIEYSILCCRTSRRGRWLETILTNAVRKKYGEEKQLTGSNLGLSSCQLLVFFALCTGASSDPMVRTYTRKNAMEELEKAKRGIPSNPCTGEEIKQSFSTKGSR
ncbi:hypothetical protein MUK42_33326 [Musa troglodytarum]|uniref:DUF547 domain-containing protein n=1 Tax=Musa troglodytarum TaxID=320322 RepID=A0A9E7EW23_9LILI|nr:hypothetical protein MUK42_33326 [Musa troglodytarum]URD85044.1 hypothetical protein MUK42_33326 [Musa troglodytarum]